MGSHLCTETGVPHENSPPSFHPPKKNLTRYHTRRWVCGHWPSFTEFATEQADEYWVPQIPEAVRSYFDYERYAREYLAAAEKINEVC